MLTESKCVKQSSNEREVELTEVKGGGVGWGGAQLHSSMTDIQEKDMLTESSVLNKLLTNLW